MERQRRSHKAQWTAHFQIFGRDPRGQDIVPRGKILQGKRKGIRGRRVILQECDLNASTTQPIW
jgi:hypothetical protein